MQTILDNKRLSEQEKIAFRRELKLQAIIRSIVFLFLIPGITLLLIIVLFNI